MKTFTPLLILALAASSFAQISGVPKSYIPGGNIFALTPRYTAADQSKADGEMKALGPGATCRVPSIDWEINWGPNPVTANYKAIDAYFELAHKYRQKLEILLSPTPYPGSAWYVSSPWSDWWCPPAWAYPDISNCTNALIKYCEDKSKSLGVAVDYQLLNELGGTKPGASNRTIYGEWHPDFAPFTDLIVKALQNNGVAAARTVYPAISCMGEPNESAEFATCFLPSLSACGTVDFHVRLMARSATNPATHLADVRKGFDRVLTYLDDQIKWHSGFKGKRIVIGELYVTPADVARKLGDDITAECQIALDACKAHGYPVIVWGLDTSGDVPNDPYNTFSQGWTKFFGVASQ